MGYIRHHTICITSLKDTLIKKVYKKSKDICKKYNFNLVTGLYESKINGYQTFYIIPDGSKEYWGESEVGNLIRKEIINYIDSLKYEDGSNSISYAKLFYGDDWGDSEVIKHN